MLQESICPAALSDVTEYLSAERRRERILQSSAVLVQIFAGTCDTALVSAITHAISAAIPEAVIVGASSMGEIFRGALLIKSTCAISFSYFDTSLISCMMLDTSEIPPFEAGRAFQDFCCASPEDTRGALLLCTTKTMNAQKLLDGMEGCAVDFPIIGAGAACYDNTTTTYIIYGEQIIENGAVMALFSGSDLKFEPLWCNGWKPMSRVFTVTNVSSDGLTVRTIDGEPAQRLYKKYLGISDREKFCWDVIEFPLVVRRGGTELARIPLDCGNSGELIFAADVIKGEGVRLAYGDHEIILHDAARMHEEMLKFNPQGITIYNCGSRRFFFGTEADTETLPFEDICSTSGFYTSGEITGSTKKMLLQNMTMAAFGIREGEPAPRPKICKPQAEALPESGSASFQVRLVHFIKAIVAEYEVQNRELRQLSKHDSLTGLYNRGATEKKLNEYIAESDAAVDSVFLLDIDLFKQINDRLGHYTGDIVLTELSRVMERCCGEDAFIGRWGGEEFMVLLHGVSGEEAEMLAEELRSFINRYDFRTGMSVTVSIGVTQICKGDTIDSVYRRVDRALYSAKESGRNKVSLES